MSPDAIAEGGFHVLPLVSIVVTAFNYERFIEGCLASIARQTYDKFECIVVDDCSTDNTAGVVVKLLAQHGDARFSLHRNDTNLGQLGAQAAGLALSRGTFVVFLDADDLLASRFVERHVFAHLNTTYPAGFSVSDQITIDDDGVVHSGTRLDRGSYREVPHARPLRLETPDQAALDVLFLPWHDASTHSEKSWWWLAQSGMMFRRSVLSLIVPDPSACGDFKICSDYYLARFAHLTASSMILMEPLGSYRQHCSNSFSSSSYLSIDQQNGDVRRHPGFEAYARLVLAILEDRRESFTLILGEARIAAIRKAIARRRKDPSMLSQIAGVFSRP